MARHLADLPGREVAEDLGGLDLQLFAQPADFLIDVERLAATGVAKFFDLRLQFGDGLLEIEEIGIHGQRWFGKTREYSGWRRVPVCAGVRCDRSQLSG
jgi:hypothetical protein